MTFVLVAVARNTKNAVDLTNSFRAANKQQGTKQNNLLGILCSLFTGIALCFCYPNANLFWLAWIVLAPLFTALLSVSSRGRCIFLTWLCGVTFFTGSLHFLTFVAFAAWPALAILESLYWILLGVLFFEARNFSSRIFRILWLALSFTAVEFLRAEIPVWAFGLNLLGHSQAFQPALIQVASLGGAVLLTFLIVFANACFAEYWIGEKNQRFLPAAALVVLLFVFH